ncbi:MAG: 30S ribosomal protein S15 [Candidatus Aenigmarchaeota archaeon]|nr:30S ribosomal protein S15 [Candidatus Aenigmarchaeota archaeon]MDW8160276.1 30S ribosomal protein S15 [Candidatus Aenigmarchaeota archaeon]
MARMYSRKKGKSRSHKPPIRIVPRWLTYKKDQVYGLVVELAKKGYSSAMIGTILRDQYGIPDVKTITGKSIKEIMQENNLYPEYPEELLNLFRKAVNLHDHLKKHKKDKTSKKGYENLVSKINRLIKYYKKRKVLSKDFVFDIERARLIVQK